MTDVVNAKPKAKPPKRSRAELKMEPKVLSPGESDYLIYFSGNGSRLLAMAIRERAIPQVLKYLFLLSLVGYGAFAVGTRWTAPTVLSALLRLLK